VRRWPQLQLEGVGLACHEPTSGFADPVLTVETIVAAAQREYRLHVYEGCDVLGISTANGHVTGVVTGDGEIVTGVVVNACGPWSDRIGRMAGVDYPLEFSREHEAIFDAPERMEDFPVISDVPQALYCRPYVGGKILVGDGWPKQKEPVDPETYDDGTDDAHVSKMVPRLINRLPALGPTLTQANYGGAFVTGYSGVYDITEDWYPIVGEEELGGYYSCFGGSGHGFKIGPAIGESLAALIAGQEPRIDISSLSGARFSEGRTFGSVWGPGNRA
jgi:sarcosine oxidase, subunit beta